jgi:tetratricopeptide (TPR) repeat protein
VASTLNNLAGLFQDQGKYSEVELLYNRALKIYEKALGPEHPNVASTLNNLAGLFQAQGKNTEAEELAERAKEIRSKYQ